MKYKAVIYDIDGTLIDTFAQNVYPLQQVVKEVLGKDMHYDELVTYMSHNGKDVLPQLGISNDFYDVWVDYINVSEHVPYIYEGMLEVLQALNGVLVQAVVSSKRRKQYNIDFGKLDLLHFFSASVMADEVTFTKPHPFPLLKCLDELKIEAKDAIYIGDSIFDYQAAKAAGMDFGLALWGNLTQEGMDSIDFIFEHPRDILEAIK